MQTLIHKLPAGAGKDQSHIFSMLPVALSNVPFHNNSPSLTRYFSEAFPFYPAVHEISPVLTPPMEYTRLHTHDDFDEVNIIISRESLLYKIQLDREKYTVSNNSCIWIPRGMPHAANVLEGSGFYITLRLN